MNARYLATTLLTSAILLGAHALLCWWVDPYAIYRQPADRPTRTGSQDLFHHLRLSKAYQLEHRRPATLILGSSRAAALSPAVVAAPDEAAYNAALPGMTGYELWSYFRHVTAIRVPARLIIALDYEAFLTDDELYRLGFSERRLAKSPADTARLPRLRRHYPDYGPALFSFASGRSALTTLFGAAQGGTWVFPDGTWLEQPSPGRPAMTGRRGYQFVIRRHFARLSSQRPNYELSYLGNVVDECHRLGIDVTFYISPVHHTLATVYQQTQHQESRLQWQRDVVRLLADRAAANRAQPFPLWGFEGIGASSEDIAPVAQASDWYRDGIHISTRFGQTILNELFATDGAPVYGQRLNERSIAGYLHRTIQALRDYQLRHVEEMRWLTTLTGDVAARSIK